MSDLILLCCVVGLLKCNVVPSLASVLEVPCILSARLNDCDAYILRHSVSSCPIREYRRLLTLLLQSNSVCSQHVSAVAHRLTAKRQVCQRRCAIAYTVVSVATCSLNIQQRKRCLENTLHWFRNPRTTAFASPGISFQLWFTCPECGAVLARHARPWPGAAAHSMHIAAECCHPTNASRV